MASPTNQRGWSDEGGRGGYGQGTRFNNRMPSYITK